VANFYLDNRDIRFHLEHPAHTEMERIVRLQERDFAEKDEYAHAPSDVEDALDNYSRILEIVGSIAGDTVAPQARGVDREGAKLDHGEVHYAQGTKKDLHKLSQADLMGFTLSRAYGGLNCPKTVYSLAIEIISRADASLMNLFGLQEIADTIERFGSEEQKQRYLPRFATGDATGAMALTEPDAGSDLQAVRLRAEQDDSGNWRLNGVKRFITNGCGDVVLVLARSESGSSSGRGLSLFIYQRDENMRIRRIEDKLGIHGSPTCEMQFNKAPAELLGRRRMGLVRYTLSLMNGARLAVAAQAIGVAEAAFREARSYASYRRQFQRTIADIPPVREMLSEMRVNIAAARSLVMETSRIVDVQERLEQEMESGSGDSKELKEEMRRYSRYASYFTPAVKIFATEMANKVCYDALQVHGGPGYTRDFDVERLYRDVRITNIYEGTTQLQVVGAIGSLVTGVVSERLDEYEAAHDFSGVEPLFSRARELRQKMEQALGRVREQNDAELQQYHAGRLVEMANDAIMAYLLCIDALSSDAKQETARVFIARAASRTTANLAFIHEAADSVLHKKVALEDD
jgi:hypothetical protein